MIEVTGNLWTFPADVRCITTNGFVKKNGECVMGRGCAREAAKKLPQLPKLLGDFIKNNGNHVGWLYGSTHGDIIFSFPVKHNWWERADLDLIARSAEEIKVAVPGKRTVLIPRPGCGNGQLSWDDVKPVIEPILADDRFKIISF